MFLSIIPVEQCPNPGFKNSSTRNLTFPAKRLNFFFFIYDDGELWGTISRSPHTLYVISEREYIFLLQISLKMEGLFFKQKKSLSGLGK